MKVLITGGAGFIGSHLADHLLARGDQVTVIDNYATGRRDNLVTHPRLKVVEGTIADADLVSRVFVECEPECAVHAAASYKDPENWSEDIRTNVLGTANVVRAAACTGVRRLIYFQTALGYGLHPQEQPITLAHPLKPEGSSYAASKTAGENYVAMSGIPFVSFRLANAYGPRNISGPLPTFFQRLTSQQKCFVVKTRRDFVYVRDLIAVVVKSLDGIGGSGFYHVASGQDYSIKELYDEVVRALGMRFDEPVEEREKNPEDAFSILLDPSKTERDFDWSVTTPLSEGVRCAVEYYRQYGIRETFTHLRLATV